jgi:hypothetical protein
MANGDLVEKNLVRKYGIKAQELFKIAHINNEELDIPLIGS